jgi:2-keto-4-pentenoate hydratase/2-oxohepta-3-ene-1,7-dioic acid hydratase in catechol pathway
VSSIGKEIAMRFVTYRRNDVWRCGVQEGDRLVDLGPSLKAMLAAERDFDRIVDRAAELLRSNSPRLSRQSTDLGPAIPDPDKIICLGLNYRAHAEEAQLTPPPDIPIFFAKFRNSLIGPRANIVIPRNSSQIDYEGELAVILGRRCKDVRPQDALQYVFGYACFNDVSARDHQMRTSQWIAGKAFDSFGPFGPGITPAREVADPQNLTLTTRLNGTEVQKAATKDMIFSVAESISYLSSLMTLEPGDLVATGTPAGVGFTRQPPLWLKDGDLIEVEITGLGLLQNPVVGADRASG